MARGIDNKPGDVCLSALAYAAVTSNPAAGRRPGGLFVKLYAADTQQFTLAGVGDNPLGVFRGNCAVGAAGEIETAGVVPITFGGTVADDAFIEVGALGVAVTATGLRPIAGRCIKGGASGEVGTVLLGVKPTNEIKGVDVASAATIVPTGNVFHVTGTGTITAITSTGVVAGSRMTLIFDGAASITAGSLLKLVSSFTASAGNAITLTYDGTAWYESGRLVTQTLTTPNGAQIVEGYVEELVTLSTSGTTTDTSANLLPANSESLGVVARVETTIVTATDWKLGDASEAARFAAPNSTLTAGTTQVGVAHRQGGISTDGTGPINVSAAKIRITTTGTPSAGKIRVANFYRQLVAPTS